LSCCQHGRRDISKAKVSEVEEVIRIGPINDNIIVAARFKDEGVRPRFAAKNVIALLEVSPKSIVSPMFEEA